MTPASELDRLFREALPEIPKPDAPEPIRDPLEDDDDA
jgi:hypothetical protein